MVAITIHGLSKKYLIGHDRQAHFRYRTLTDTLTASFQSALRRVRHPFSTEGAYDDIEVFWALRDVEMTVGQGDRVGIIGRNGAGKSTLLKILSRITLPTSGNVRVRGRVSSLLEVGTGFHPELSGRENIFLNGAVLGMSKRDIKHKFDEIVAFSEVERFLDTPVKRYSSGMYMRLAFSIAAHLEPEILIVDEVLAVGDAAFQKKCLGKMKDVGNEGRTVLLVSHNLAAIKSLCDTAVCLQDGQVLATGETSEVVNEYLGKGFYQGAEHIWHDREEQAGNKNVELHRISAVSPLTSDNKRYFAVDTPVNIEFVYTLKLDVDMFYVSFHLQSITSECVFISGSSPARMAGGKYKSTCHIPANLLNDGIYTLHVYFVRDGNVVLHEIERPINFEVHDVDREEGAWMGEYLGFIRPKLDWQTEIIDQ